MPLPYCRNAKNGFGINILHYGLCHCIVVVHIHAISLIRCRSKYNINCYWSLPEGTTIAGKISLIGGAFTLLIAVSSRSGDRELLPSPCCLLQQLLPCPPPKPQEDTRERRPTPVPNREIQEGLNSNCAKRIDA